MRRRSVIVSLSVAVAGALTGCTSQERSPSPASNAVPAPTPSATPLFASTTSSSLKPQPVTPYVPKPGTAPAQSFAVGRRDFSFPRGDRPLPVRVWYPALGTPGDEPADGLAPATGVFPAVLFSHGLTSQPNDFAAMLTRWAQAGFIVIGPTYPHTSYGAADFDALDVLNQPADASHVLTELLKLSDPLVAHIDSDRIAAAGHSGGGITTAGLLSSKRDKRLKAGIIINGTDFGGAPFAGPAAAVLMVHGRKDDTVAYGAGHTVFQAVPWSRAMLSITDGGHVTSAESFEPVTATSTEFLRWSLYGDAAAKARIPEKSTVNGVATLENEL
jgi:dienelactone hydrolase